MKTSSLVLLAVVSIGCSRAESSAGEAAAPATATTTTPAPVKSAAPAAAKADEVPGDTPELQEKERVWFADPSHKAKPAPGFAGARVPGGCASGPVRPGFAAFVCPLTPIEVFYIQRNLLKQDGWTLDVQKRPSVTSFVIEASKGKTKVTVDISRNPAEVGDKGATLALRS